MELIDTHCHLYAEEFDSDRAEMMQRAVSEGVKRFYLPAIDREQAGRLLAMEQQYPGQCFAMAGLHPCSVKANYREELDWVSHQLSQRRFAAVGEIGLDFYWDRHFDAQQYEAFETQIQWALQYDLPIVIHSRDSMSESIATVKKYQQGGLRGVFHCFGGDLATAKQIIGLGFYLGIGGVLTYKKSGLDQTLREIGLSHLVLETDAPYLTPVPFRGKRNESSYLKYIVAKLAEVKELPVEEVARITTENALRLFGE